MPLISGPCDGHIFEAFHRTMAEFLAARFMAKIVTGEGNFRRSHYGAQSRSSRTLIAGHQANFVDYMPGSQPTLTGREMRKARRA
jgi:hypothetical protein